MSRPMPNAAAPRDPDHEEHLQMEAGNRAWLESNRQHDVADDHGVPTRVVLGHWTILAGTPLEVLVFPHNEGDVQVNYRLRRDVPAGDYALGVTTLESGQ